MGNYLKRNGKNAWHFVVEGPYMILTLHPDDLVAPLLGGRNNAGQPRQEPRPPTLEDLVKLENDEIAFTELGCGVPPYLFYHSKLCQSAHEV